MQKKPQNNFFLVAIFLSLIFFFLYASFSIKAYNANVTRGDLTSYAQAMWNTSQGRIMNGTYNYSIHEFWSATEDYIPDKSNILGIHFNPILLFVFPIYLLYAHPETLLIIQAFLVCISGIFIFLLAKKIVKNNKLAIMIEISFLLNLSLACAVLSEFHAYTLSIFFGVLCIYLFTKKMNKSYFVALFLMLFVQENTAIIMFFFGLYLILFTDFKKNGILTSLISLVYFFVVINYLIPLMSAYHGYIFSSVYGNTIGSSITEIILKLLLNPKLFVTTFITYDNIIYILKIITPISPFIFFSPQVFLVSITPLIPNLISKMNILKIASLHYESSFIPFAYYSYILGIQFIINKFRRDIRVINMIFIVIIITTLLGFKLIALDKIQQINGLNPNNKINIEIEKLIKIIPQEKSVSTQDYLSAKLSNRKRLYVFPVYYEKSEYILISKNNTWPLTTNEQLTYIKKISMKQKYNKQYESDNFILFIKK